MAKCSFCGTKLNAEEINAKLAQLKKREMELDAELNNVAQERAALESGYCGVYCAEQEAQ